MNLTFQQQFSIFHSLQNIVFISFDSYIKPQLTYERITRRSRCISFDSYIKPQPSSSPALPPHRCISFDSYIKPQLSHNY